MYKIKYTERNNKKASEYETRSLLYLLAMRKDSDEISIFFVDCLNDLTGSSEDCNKLWDTQAKGVSNLNPTKIGEALITLYENHISELDFMHSILLMPKLKDGYLNDENSMQYSFNNFLDNKKQYIINGLKNEYIRRQNIENITFEIEQSINEFLKKVLFVIGNNKETYIREIVQFKDKDSHSISFYSSIFDEIRDKQSALKNQFVEGLQITHPNELIKHEKYLKSNDIKLMVLNRFVGTELFKNNFIPNSYYDEVLGMDSQDRSDLIQENNTRISRTFFNKNNKISFWFLLENILNTINRNQLVDINWIYNNLDSKLINDNYTLDRSSLLFFISIIKDGLDHDN